MANIPIIVQLPMEQFETHVRRDLTEIAFIVFTGKDGRKIQFVQDNTKVIKEVKEARRTAANNGATLEPWMTWALE